MEPLVSVVIPVYNGEKYIVDTINSVISQSYCEFEIIVVDDGSTDLTSEAVKSIKDNRIEYYYQQNSGLPAKARNHGAKIAKGNYIAFLDHDDIWFPQKLEKQMMVIKNNPQIALISTNAYLMYGLDKTRIPLLHNMKEGYFNDNSFFPNNMVVQSSALVSKHHFDAVGGLNESPDLKAIEDYDLWLRLYLKYPCYYINECVIYYRKHSESISGTKLQVLEREIHYFNKYFKEYGFGKKIVAKKLSTILYWMASNQYHSGNPEWRRTTIKAIYASPNILYIPMLLLNKFMAKIKNGS